MPRLRFAAILFALVAVTVGVLAVASSATAQSTAQAVVMTPAEGTAATRFVFTGSGFTPGQLVRVRITPPDGYERRIRNETGAEIVWPVDDGGSFTLDLTPAHLLPGMPPGRWRILFCEIDAPTCQRLEFEVLP